MMNGKIAYTDTMMATIFRRKESTVKLALTTFEQFGMIEIINGAITIPNWSKHQNFDKIEAKTEYQREYMREYRLKQKEIANTNPDETAMLSDSCKTNSNTNGKANVSSLEKSREEEIRLDKIRLDKDSIGEYEGETPKPLPTPKEPKLVKHKYGDYEKVRLDDNQMAKLKAEFPDWKERIQRLDDYVASTGKSYKDHLATIRNWAKRDKSEKEKPAFEYNSTFDPADSL